VDLTPFDVYSDNMLRIIQDEWNDAQRAAFRIDTNGDGVVDHWAGYLIFFNETWAINHLISHIYQVNLASGQAAGYNGVSWEFDNAADPVRQLNNYFNDEAFSANALWASRWLEANAAVAPTNAAWFQLAPRYYVHDEHATNWIIIWIEAFLARGRATPWNVNLLAPIPLPGALHCYFFNEEEECQSTDVPFTLEVNFINVETYVPGGLHAGYPLAGWMSIVTPDEFNRGWFYPVWDPVTNTNRLADLGSYREWIGLSWQRANNAAALAWEAIHPVHRDAGVGAPPWTQYQTWVGP
jgi:hypothetical protein